MKILLIMALKNPSNGSDNYSFRVIEEPTEKEMARIVSVNGVLSEGPLLQKFYEWIRAEEKQRPNWGVAGVDAGLYYGPFDKVVFCGGVL